MHKYFAYRAFLRLILLFLGTGLAALTAQTVLAQASTEDPTDRLFTIRGIKVDETAGRASQARETALAKAEEDAYRRLLRKLVQEEGRARLPELGLREIQAFIIGIEVVEEQSSSRRYLATLNVRFEPGLVSQFLAQHDVPHVLSTGQGIMVLHAHKRGLTRLLWENDQTMMAARLDVDWVNRIRQYEFARGEVTERAAITFGEVWMPQGWTQAPAQVRSVARRYGMRDALLIASEWVLTEPSPYLTYSYFSTDGAMTGRGEIPPGNSEQGALALMYDAVLDAIDGAWREQLLVDTGTGGNMIVLVPSTSLDILQAIESRLGDVSLVNDIETREIGLPFSRVGFRYTGREDQLVLALRYAGLSLSNYGRERMLTLRTDAE